MDQKQIDEMRKAVDMIDRTVKRADSQGRVHINTWEGDASVESLRLAVDGIRELVERAAAERAEGVTVEGDASSKALRHIRRLRDNAISASKESGHALPCIQVNAEYLDLTVRAIEASLAAKPPAPPTEPAEPTLEQCVEAMNRACHRGYIDWVARVESACAGTWMNADEFEGLGRLLIARERADAAKGGA